MKDKIKINVEQEIKELLPKYLNNRKNDLNIFKKALADLDAITIEKTAHKIAGNAGSYGLDHLGEIAKRMELESHDKELANIQKYLDEIEEYLNLIEY
ncbi:MAG: Hpt domain-containing protein [Oligoflexia bacterium]|nr:Hpt domain-containing protein [Oligoflexia bacterium]